MKIIKENVMKKKIFFNLNIEKYNLLIIHLTITIIMLLINFVFLWNIFMEYL